MPKPLSVRQHDSPLRWYVTSEENTINEYLVDLSEWSCTCRSYECRVAPMQKKFPENKTKYTCKHITLGWNAFTWLMRDAVLEMYKNQNKHEND